MAQILCPSLVGRNSELSRLQEALSAAVADGGRVVFLSGEAGIGKSRLARELEGRALSDGVRVLRGRAAQLGSPVPFRPFVEAFHTGLAEDELEGALAEPHHAVLRRLLQERPQTGPEASLLAVMDAILRLLEAVARPRGLLLVLEDLHWADDDTLAVLEYLSDNLGEARVLCLCTERTDSGGPVGDLVPALVARRAAERIELAPLSPAEVAEMTRMSLPEHELPAALIDALSERAGGVPFLVEELLSAYVGAGGTLEPQPEWAISRHLADALPPSYRDLVRERLARLDPRARKATEAAAVLGRTFDWKLLGPATGVTDDEIIGALRQAVEAQLVSSRGEHFAVAFEFRHALAREAILAELLPQERADLSLRAARAIEAVHRGVPGEWCERAAHLLAEGGDGIGAARLLQEAARRALARSALGSAERALLRARELSRDDWMVWMGVDDLLLDVLSLAGKTEGLIELGQRLVDAFEGRYPGLYAASRTADIHRRVARGLLATGDWDAAGRHLSRARRLAQSVGDERLEAMVGAVEAQLALGLGDLVRAAQLAEATAREAAELGVLDALCEALEAAGKAASRSGDGAGAVVAFTRLAEVADEPQVAVWRIRALLELGAIDGSERAEVERLLAARALAMETGAVSTLAAIELELGRVRLERAELDDAESALKRALEGSRRYRLALVPHVLVARCTLHALRNEPSRLKEAGAEAAELGDASVAAAVIADGEAVLALARADDEGALELLDRVLLQASATRPGWQGLATLLRVALRRDDASLDRLGDASSATHPLDRAYACYAEAVVHGHSARRQQAADAFAAGERLMAPGWRGHHARRVVSDAAIEDGWGEPGAWAGPALDFFDAAPLPGFAARCKSTLRRAGAPLRRRGRGASTVPPALYARGVTSREMDVLHLVGERLGNREIGERLFLSPRTIETHVKSLLRKTGGRSRADLIAVAREQRETPNPADAPA